MTAAATRIQVGGDRPYDVVIGSGVTGELPALLGHDVRRVLLVHPAGLAELVPPVERDLLAAGCEVVRAPVPDGEAAKTAEVAADLWSLLGRRGFTRSDAVVAVGGGATTDLAGFVAATWLRGIAVVHVPTTLLGMVDAAVGGKTAIDTTEGKNLVGAFHPPSGVLCDLVRRLAVGVDPGRRQALVDRTARLHQPQPLGARVAQQQWAVPVEADPRRGVLDADVEEDHL